MIKTIVFDLGGVYFENGTKNVMPRLIELIRAPKEKVKEIFTTYPYKKEGWLYRTGKISKHDFWQAAKKKLDISDKQVVEIQKLWHSSYTPMRGMKELVSELRKKYKVAAFSGNTKERIEYLDKKYGLMKDFDYYIFSFDAGYNKREKEFYDILLNKVHCSPEECIFIDDDQHALNLANRRGFKTILFKDGEQLKDELNKLNIKYS